MFRLVARVGCLRGGAIRLLDEWPHRRGNPPDRTRLTDPLTFFFAISALKGGRSLSRTLSREAYGQTDAFERLGISTLARLWRRACGHRSAPVRPSRLHRTRRPARA